MLRLAISLVVLTFGLSTAAHAAPVTLAFSGYSWQVRDAAKAGPGPNHWSSRNAWIDANGYLHLKLTQKKGQWYAAQVSTTERLGFGTYQFWLDTPVNGYDPNVVLGLFNYPTEDVGPDGTNEIDIEFARWGNAKWPNGNYTVWPTVAGAASAQSTFEVGLKGKESTQRFTWTASSLHFQSLSGHQNGNARLSADWTYAPPDPAARIGQSPMPVFINLWLFRGHAPTDGRQVEVVIRSFTFTPG